MWRRHEAWTPRCTRRRHGELQRGGADDRRRRAGRRRCVLPAILPWIAPFVAAALQARAAKEGPAQRPRSPTTRSAALRERLRVTAVRGGTGDDATSRTKAFLSRWSQRKLRGGARGRRGSRSASAGAPAARRHRRRVRRRATAAPAASIRPRRRCRRSSRSRSIRTSRRSCRRRSTRALRRAALSSFPRPALQRDGRARRLHRRLLEAGSAVARE